MFRVVTELVPTAGFLLLCDHPHCGNTAVASMVPETPQAERVKAVSPFIKGAIEQGWVIGIDAHLCPQHANRIAEGRKLVVPAFAFRN